LEFPRHLRTGESEEAEEDGDARFATYELASYYAYLDHLVIHVSAIRTSATQQMASNRCRRSCKYLQLNNNVSFRHQPAVLRSSHRSGSHLYTSKDCAGFSFTKSGSLSQKKKHPCFSQSPASAQSSRSKYKSMLARIKRNS
jgi:hypothetical protein